MSKFPMVGLDNLDNNRTYIWILNSNIYLASIRNNKLNKKHRLYKIMDTTNRLNTIDIYVQIPYVRLDNLEI